MEKGSSGVSVSNEVNKWNMGISGWCVKAKGSAIVSPTSVSSYIFYNSISEHLPFHTNMYLYL